jgi:hypothetical protein
LLALSSNSLPASGPNVLYDFITFYCSCHLWDDRLLCASTQFGSLCAASTADIKGYCGHAALFQSWETVEARQGLATASWLSLRILYLHLVLTFFMTFLRCTARAICEMIDCYVPPLNVDPCALLVLLT